MERRSKLKLKAADKVFVQVVDRKFIAHLRDGVKRQPFQQSPYLNAFPGLLLQRSLLLYTCPLPKFKYIIGPFRVGIREREFFNSI